MGKFEIIIEIQEPTEKQRNQEKYLLRHRMIVQESNYFREWLYCILNDKIDFSFLNDKEVLLIRYKRTGTRKIEFSSILNRQHRNHIRLVIENSYSRV